MDADICRCEQACLCRDHFEASGLFTHYQVLESLGRTPHPLQRKLFYNLSSLLPDFGRGMDFILVAF